jgi:hypothetical protein
MDDAGTKRDGEADVMQVATLWSALQRMFRSGSPGEPADEAARLRRELSGRYERLVERRRRIERLRGELERLESRMTHLTAQVAACFGKDDALAWQRALELDRIRGEAEQTRDLLMRQEAKYRHRREKFEERKRRLHQVQRG